MLPEIRPIQRTKTKKLFTSILIISKKPNRLAQKSYYDWIRFTHSNN
jgi:hypothetical protein